MQNEYFQAVTIAAAEILGGPVDATEVKRKRRLAYSIAQEEGGALLAHLAQEIEKRKHVVSSEYKITGCGSQVETAVAAPPYRWSDVRIILSIDVNYEGDLVISIESPVPPAESRTVVNPSGEEWQSSLLSFIKEYIKLIKQAVEGK